MSNISLEHYIGREVVRGTTGGSTYITLDGDVKIFNEDKNRDMEEVPKGSRLVMITMDKENTQAIFQDEEGHSHPLTLTALQHSLSDPDRTDGEKVVLQGGVDTRDLSVPPVPSERDSESEEHQAELQKAHEAMAETQPAEPEDEPEEEGDDEKS
jgi:hypothetical protein